MAPHGLLTSNLRVHDNYSVDKREMLCIVVLWIMPKIALYGGGTKRDDMNIVRYPNTFVRHDVLSLYMARDLAEYFLLNLCVRAIQRRKTPGKSHGLLYL